MTPLAEAYKSICADGNDPDALGAMCVNALNREI